MQCRLIRVNRKPGLVWLTEVMVCLLAAPLVRAVIITIRQFIRCHNKGRQQSTIVSLAATSVSRSCKQYYSKCPELNLYFT